MRDKKFKELEKKLDDINKGKKGSLSLSDYFYKYQDFYITTAVVFLIDQIFLNGALKDKLQSMAEKVLSRTGNKLLEKEKII